MHSRSDPALCGLPKRINVGSHVCFEEVFSMLCDFLQYALFSPSLVVELPSHQLLVVKASTSLSSSYTSAINRPKRFKAPLADEDY